MFIWRHYGFSYRALHASVDILRQQMQFVRCHFKAPRPSRQKMLVSCRIPDDGNQSWFERVVLIQVWFGVYPRARGHRTDTQCNLPHPASGSQNLSNVIWFWHPQKCAIQCPAALHTALRGMVFVTFDHKDTGKNEMFGEALWFCRHQSWFVTQIWRTSKEPRCCFRNNGEFSPKLTSESGLFSVLARLSVHVRHQTGYARASTTDHSTNSLHLTKQPKHQLYSSLQGIIETRLLHDASQVPHGRSVLSHGDRQL